MRGYTAPNFHPLGLPGSLFLLDPVAAIKSGNIVSQWTDVSVNGNHATAGGAQQPTFGATAFGGAPGIVFDGVNHSMVLASPISTAMTIIGAYYSTGAVAFAPLLGSTIASGGYTDLIGESDGLGLLSWNTSQWRTAAAAVNGRDFKGSAAIPVGTHGTFGCQKPTAPSILSITGLESIGLDARYNRTPDPPPSYQPGAHFNQIAQDRSTTSRRDPCVWGMLYATSSVLTPFQRWQVEQWMANTLIARGCTSSLLPTTRRLVIFKGDSQTFGAQAYYDETIPAQTALPCSVINLGWHGTQVGGNLSSSMITLFPTEVLPLIQQAKRALAASVTVVLRGGTNDLQVGGLSAAQTLANIKAYHALIQGAGAKSIAIPILDRSVTEPPIAGFRTNRDTVNAAMLADTSFCDYYVANVATDVNVGTDGAPDRNVGVYFGDGIHETELGATTTAGYVIPGIDALQAGT